MARAKAKPIQKNYGTARTCPSLRVRSKTGKTATEIKERVLQYDVGRTADAMLPLAAIISHHTTPLYIGGFNSAHVLFLVLGEQCSTTVDSSTACDHAYMMMSATTPPIHRSSQYYMCINNHRFFPMSIAPPDAPLQKGSEATGRVLVPARRCPSPNPGRSPHPNTSTNNRNGRRPDGSRRLCLFLDIHQVPRLTAIYRRLKAKADHLMLRRRNTRRDTRSPP